MIQDHYPKNSFTFIPGKSALHDIGAEDAIIKLKEVEKSLNKDKNQFKILFEQVAIGFAIISIDGRWVRINRKLLDIFGYSEEELFGQPFLGIRHPDDNETNFENINKLLSGNTDKVWLDISFINRYGIKGWINFNATLVCNTQGAPLYFLCIIDDITERKLAEEDLKNQNDKLIEVNEKLNIAQKNLEKKTEELEKASKYKSEFLANMSHELRSPMNSMLILAQYLSDNKDGNLNEDQVQSAQIINKSGNNLLSLINDILDLSKIEAGKMNVYIHKFELREIKDNMDSSFSHMAKEKGLNFYINIADKLPKNINTDQQKLEQIIKNFASNAIKFTAKGSVIFDINRPLPGTDLSNSRLSPEKSIAFSVRDTGIGIPQSKQREIFEAFQQADGSTTRDYGGTGLGLSISRELAKLLGGEIQLNSIEGKGSTFTIYIPEKMKMSDNIVNDRRSKGRPKKSLPKTTKYNKTLFQNKKVLITDDDMRNLFALSKVLNETGANVYKATNGEMALEILNEEHDIDILLTDIMMPGIDGYETMRRIRAQDCFKDLPIFAVTAKAMKEDQKKCISAGANEYISKPIDIDRLISLLDVWLNKTPSND